MASFDELLAAARAGVAEIDPASLVQRLHDDDVVLLDVREPDEVANGLIDGALKIPRGVLETSVGTLVPDRSASVVAYCASGVRSVFAAQTLAALGYENVASLAGGFDRWKSEGMEWVLPGAVSLAESARYRRHVLLPEIGLAGQQRLLESSVLLVGLGGLGSPAALYLAAAGVGRIGLVDMDVVDETNLQRQVIHNTTRIGQAKVESARAAITQLNPDVEVVPIAQHLSAENVLEVADGWDVIIDGADNFDTRYLLNDASVKLGIPVVYGSIFRFEGQISVFDPVEGPTYRDFMPKPPPPELAPNCAEAGVLGVLPGVVGTIQAVEAIKLLLGLGTSLRGRLLTFDAMDMTFREFRIPVDPANPITHTNRDLVVIAQP
ncbi:MAG: molybdopterin-synthase adenylyltransferase MoeB [Acidimicrobiales bacterium]|nr:molybdopterin-synthase adenylyltransferase MoeB [Acidimicrobiales bacterium]